MGGRGYDEVWARLDTWEVRDSRLLRRLRNSTRPFPGRRASSDHSMRRMGSRLRGNDEYGRSRTFAKEIISLTRQTATLQCDRRDELSVQHAVDLHHVTRTQLG